MTTAADKQEFKPATPDRVFIRMCCCGLVNISGTCICGCPAMERVEYVRVDFVATAIATARVEVWQKALDALRRHQESFVVDGGRDARSREKQRRQAIYIRGLDDARGALEAEAAKDTKE